MKTDITRKDWEALLKYLASQFNSGKVRAPLHKGKNIKKWTVDMVQDVIRDSTATPSTPTLSDGATPTAYTDGTLGLPRMEAYMVSSVIYHTRRPEFFSALSDVEYCQLFSNLWNLPDAKCPSWQSWSVMVKDIAEPTAKVLKHMTFWFDPG